MGLPIGFLWENPMKWRIYYGDPGGKVYDGNCSEHAYFAPDHGVQVLKIEVPYDVDKKLYILKKGFNFYCWENGISEAEPIERWSGKGDESGREDYYHYHIGPQKIIYGRDIDLEIYHRVMKKARDEGNFETGTMNFKPRKCHLG